MKGGAKALQETVPPPHEPPKRVHVISDSTLRVGQENLVLHNAFHVALRAQGTDTEFGAYRLRCDGDLFDLTSMCLGILDNEVDLRREETRETSWKRDRATQDWINTGGETMVSDHCRLCDIPDGTIDSSIQVWWSGNDFMVGGGRKRWSDAEVEAHNAAHPMNQLGKSHRMVDGWSPEFTSRIACLSAILRKFRAPIVIGPGRAAELGLLSRLAV